MQLNKKNSMNVIIEKIEKLIVHNVGNKSYGEGIKFSQEETIFTNSESSVLKLIQNVFKYDSLYEFHFTHDLSLNPVYNLINLLFNDKSKFIDVSQSLASHLYNQSTHPKIKGGDFYIIYLKDCLIDDEIVDGVAILKSENKDVFLNIKSISNGFELESVLGISIDKLDKGCLIFNTNKEKGFLLSVLDNTNKSSDAQYWFDNFLSVKERKDQYYNTQNVLSMCKDFISKELSDKFEIKKTDQADLLNKSAAFFKEENVFEFNKFASEVIENPEYINSFNTFKTNYEKEKNVDVQDNFEISERAIKKQARFFKSVLKLDKNFHIYIHGKKELIEKGVDKNGKKFYKIYFEEESWKNKIGVKVDQKGLAKDVSNIGHRGNGNFQIQIENDKDIEYIMSLIKQVIK